jgi:hypothetical protein
MNDNPLRKTIVSGFLITAIGIWMIFAPELIGIDAFKGGFAISFGGFFLAIAGIIVIVFYVHLAGILDRILRGENQLAHWTYSPKIWHEYTEKEYAEEKSEKKGLFFVVSAFALFFGSLFWLIDPESGFYVFLSMISLIAIIAFTWQFSAWHYYKQNKTGEREAYISRDGIYMNRKLYTWHLLGSRLMKVEIEDKHGLPLLIFKITAITLPGPQTYRIRVPVPIEQQEKAKAIIEQLNSEK